MMSMTTTSYKTVHVFKSFITLFYQGIHNSWSGCMKSRISQLFAIRIGSQDVCKSFKLSMATPTEVAALGSSWYTLRSRYISGYHHSLLPFTAWKDLMVSNPFICWSKCLKTITPFPLCFFFLQFSNYIFLSSCLAFLVFITFLIVLPTDSLHIEMITYCTSYTNNRTCQIAYKYRITGIKMLQNW